MLSQVKFRCGHVGIMNLTGQAEARAKKLEWYANHVICPDCRMNAATNNWTTQFSDSAISSDDSSLYTPHD